jgi:hypothetical protein
MMMKLAFTLIILLSPGYMMYAQQPMAIADKQLESMDPSFQEDLFTNYASIVLDLGLDFLHKAPNRMKTEIFKLKWPNVSVYYNMPIKESHFMVSPGLSLGRYSYTFKDDYTLTRIGDGEKRRTDMEKAKTLLSDRSKAEHSSLDINYINLVTEFRFNTNRLEPQGEFFIAVGGNLGLLISSSTTINYREDDQKKARITKESFNFNRIRYGLLARVGWGRFGAFYSQTLSDLFNGKGPSKEVIRPFSIGLTLSLL